MVVGRLVVFGCDCVTNDLGIGELTVLVQSLSVTQVIDSTSVVFRGVKGGRKLIVVLDLVAPLVSSA